MIAMIALDALTFWVSAPLIVIFALLTVLSRKTVHAALSLCALMVALGVLYASLQAPFLFVAQIIVYTGSVMMIFLFTMMLIGIDSAEDLKETLAGHRVVTAVGVFGLAGLLVFAVAGAVNGPEVGLEEANAAGNAVGIAELVFSRYAFAFEVASAMVVVAAIGAMILAHTERLSPRRRQRELLEERLRDWASDGADLGPRPGPGVYARHNSIEYPALGPHDAVVAESISETLVVRGSQSPPVSEMVAPARLAAAQVAPGGGAATAQTAQTGPLGRPPRAAGTASTARAIGADRKDRR
ncbi:MAG: NADH-quinone oxidoreductase subunit J [Propionibacteriaceae bacterium]|jgi:NADH-quinone oxidoreductase subunit J|nr:NADH-quinone oxidoreductase subunit J [Propionibacteriaceae bacterium]